MSEILRLRGDAPEATLADLHALLCRSFAFMEGRIDPPSSLHALRVADMRNHADRAILLAAIEAGRPVGCLFARRHADHLYLGKLAVDAGARGRGIARALIDHAAGIARDTGLPLLRLQTRVELTENHAAFAALGFLRVGQTAHPGFDRPTSVTFERAVT